MKQPRILNVIAMVHGVNCFYWPATTYFMCISKDFSSLKMYRQYLLIALPEFNVERQHNCIFHNYLHT